MAIKTGLFEYPRIQPLIRRWKLMQVDSLEHPKQSLWYGFVAHHKIAEESLPLFDVDHGAVTLKSYGKDERLVLQRSHQMEAKMRGLGRILVDEHRNQAVQHEGILYIMLTRDSGGLVPRYIGKAEIYGKGDNNLSANISDLRTGHGKFGRWGYNYAYHLGDLSAVTCPGHHPNKETTKYKDWRDQLFTLEGSSRVIPKAEILFWATLWGPTCQSVWRQYGQTKLAFEEYLLIGVASDIFGSALLNREGRGRYRRWPSA